MGKKKSSSQAQSEIKPSEKMAVEPETKDVLDLEEPSKDIVSHVLGLGGSKKDLHLIDISDGSEVEDLEIDDGDSEPIKRDDILQIIADLGIRKERPEFAKKEKKIKLVTSEYVAAEQPTTSKEKKKSKNKFKLQDDEISSTTPPESVDAEAADPETTTEGTDADLTSLLSYIKKGYTKRSYLLVKPGRWLAQLGSKDNPVHTGRPHPQLSEVEEFAKRILDDDINICNSKSTGADKSDAAWRKRMVSSGTLADRAAALTTLVQEDVVHNVSSLESMVNMMKKKDRRESMAAIGSLKDVFVDLLPNKRKLRTFSQMPLDTLHTLSSGNKDTQDRILALWYFESHLKEIYATFVEAVLAATFDTVSAHKLTALKVALDLLMYKPEQEQKLLAGLANKLGDPERKVAANVAHLLSRLVKKHPNMKMIVACEVENILYRPNIAKKAQYYAVCFLNQMLLSEGDRELAVKLVTIYFSFFKASVKSQEVDSKLMSALLVGVVRAFPFTKGSEKLQLDSHIADIYKLVHTVNKFHVSLQALMLLYQVCTTSDSMSDRYYTSLYAKLLDPEINSSSKQSMFLNLVYKSMKSDPSDRRCKAFVKRLLQICAFQSATFICSALITISEVRKHRPTIISLKATVLEGDEESDEERFVDVDSDSDAETAANSKSADSKDEITPGWTHKPSTKDKYDGLSRNPLYCHADKAIETELTLLSRHYHPSVCVFANHLLKSEAIVYKGDPMADFSLQKFLDRFVFRNPKKLTKQDKTEHILSSHKKGKVKGGPKINLPVNTEEFYNMETAMVPADQKFFHSYFHKLTEGSKHKLGSRLGEGNKAEDSYESDVDDNDFDSYLSKYERSLYSDMKEDAFGADFASDFKKKSSSKGSKSEDGEGSGSESGLSEGELDDDMVDFDLKPSDFGLDDKDLEDGGISGSKHKVKKEAADSDSDASSDLPLDMEGDDVMGDFDSDNGDDIEGLFAPAPEFDEEDVEFSDDEFSSLDFSGKSKNKGSNKPASKMSKHKRPAKGALSSGKNSGSLFAAADEFADLLDEESADLRDSTTSHAVVNRGKTGAKQLAWEDKQERWLSDKGRSKKHTHKPTRGKQAKRGRRK